MIEQEFVKHIVKRLGRIDAGEGWSDDLNPAQKSALEYLSRANRFSRSPSQVANFLGSTRGTVSQTLKSLARKGYVEEMRSATDKRSISYQLTNSGREAVAQHDVLGAAMEDIPPLELSRMAKTLRKILDQALEKNRQRSFGLCHSCIHFVTEQSGIRCGLLNKPLEAHQATQICFEQTPKEK